MSEYTPDMAYLYYFITTFSCIGDYFNMAHKKAWLICESIILLIISVF